MPRVGGRRSRTSRSAAAARRRAGRSRGIVGAFSMKRSMDDLLRDTLRARAADPTAACLDPDTAAAFVDGAMSRRERADTEAHVADCPRCQAVLAALVRIDAAATRARVVETSGGCLARAADGRSDSRRDLDQCSGSYKHRTRPDAARPDPTARVLAGSAAASWASSAPAAVADRICRRRRTLHRARTGPRSRDGGFREGPIGSPNA